MASQMTARLTARETFFYQGPLAKWLRQGAHNASIVGSSPTGSIH